MNGLPLKGIRIVSFEQFGAAPYATMFLADLGAEVLKIETGDGDYARRTGPQTLGPNDSLYFQCFNLNKKSVRLDLRSEEGRAFLHDLVATSDAVVNNLRGHLPQQLGLDYAALGQVNPSIVCGHISAYGRMNHRSSWPGYDFLMQAEAGLMSLTGEPGSPPTRMGVSIIDYMTGMMMAFGVVSAIHGAAQSGRGSDVDVSLYDAAVHQLAYQGMWYLNENVVTTAAPRSAHPSSTPVQLFKTADGWVYVACMNDNFWSLLVTAIDLPGLADDPRFSSLESRLENRDALTQLLDTAFSARTTAIWTEALSSTVPIAPVYDLEHALTNPFLIDESGMIGEVDHPQRAGMRVLANPIRIDGNRLPQTPGPALGAHTEALRRELGRLDEAR